MKLWVYVVRRLILLIPTLIGLTFIVFVLSHAQGPDYFLAQYVNPRLPLAQQLLLRGQLTQEFHLNDPIYVQYFYWLAQVLQGNLGVSTSQRGQGQPVLLVLSWYLPNTLMLSILASVGTWFLSVPIGLYSASRRDSLLDQSVRVATFTLYSMPIFLIGLFFFLTMGTSWGWLPSDGAVNPLLLTTLPSSWFNSLYSVTYPTHIYLIDGLLHGDWAFAWDAFLHLILPMLTLVLAILAGIVRLLRASMLEVLEQDYVRLARAKGVSDRVVNNFHAKKNALLPAVTSFGYLVAGLLGGVVVVEVIFTFPGIGLYATYSVVNGDVAAIMGTTFLFGLILVFTSLTLDIIYGFIDPRIRYD